MSAELLRKLPVGDELNQEFQTIVPYILVELKKEMIWSSPNRFTPVAVFVYGSLLDSSRFDRNKNIGEKSDLDFLVIVTEDFMADNFHRIGMRCSPSNAINLVRTKHFYDSKDNWGSERDIDVVIMSTQNINWEISRIDSLTDTEVADLFKDDAYLTSLASGFALFNNLEEPQIKGLFRLQRIYHNLEIKPRRG